MFDALSSFGWLFGGLVLLVGGSVGAGVLIRNARERRYLAVDAVRVSSDEE